MQGGFPALARLDLRKLSLTTQFAEQLSRIELIFCERLAQIRRIFFDVNKAVVSRIVYRDIVNFFKQRLAFQAH